MEHLIADSGIHFITNEIEFNPSEPLLLSGGKTLKYSFCETIDFLEGYRIFNILYYDQDSGKYIPIDEMQNTDDCVIRRPNGREELDVTGMVQKNPLCSTTLLTTYDEGNEDVFSINSMLSFRVKDPQNPHAQISAFELLLDKWLPMPMFRKEIDGVTSNYPMGWCRMKMQRIGQGSKKGIERFRLIWAFDTQMAEDELSVLRPYITEDENGSAESGMCN